MLMNLLSLFILILALLITITQGAISKHGKLFPRHFQFLYERALGRIDARDLRADLRVKFEDIKLSFTRIIRNAELLAKGDDEQAREEYAVQRVLFIEKVAVFEQALTMQPPLSVLLENQVEMEFHNFMLRRIMACMGMHMFVVDKDELWATTFAPDSLPYFMQTVLFEYERRKNECMAAYECYRNIHPPKPHLFMVTFVQSRWESLQSFLYSSSLLDDCKDLRLQQEMMILYWQAFYTASFMIPLILSVHSEMVREQRIMRMEECRGMKLSRTRRNSTVRMLSHGSTMFTDDLFLKLVKGNANLALDLAHAPVELFFRNPDEVELIISKVNRIKMQIFSTVRRVDDFKVFFLKNDCQLNEFEEMTLLGQSSPTKCKIMEPVYMLYFWTKTSNLGFLKDYCREKPLYDPPSVFEIKVDRFNNAKLLLSERDLVIIPIMVLFHVKLLEEFKLATMDECFLMVHTFANLNMFFYPWLLELYSSTTYMLVVYILPTQKTCRL